MTLRVFLLSAFATAIFFWTVWGLIISWLDPGESPLMGFTLFFLTLFLAVSATSAFLGYGVRRLLTPGQLPAYHVRPALRQGIWLGLFLDVLLFLQLNRLLRWWVVVIIIVMFVSLEFFFLAYDRVVKNQSVPSQRDRHV